MSEKIILSGEVHCPDQDTTTVQVFEETTEASKPGAETATGDAISVTLGPGILSNLFDGIQRPLKRGSRSIGKYISRGVCVDSRTRRKNGMSHATVKPGDGGSRRHDICRNSGDQIYPAQVHDPALAWRYDQKRWCRMGLIPFRIRLPCWNSRIGTTRDPTLCQKWPIRIRGQR